MTGSEAPVTGLNELIFALRACIGSGNWYAALALAMMLPDVAGAATWPELRGEGKSKARVTRWVREYVGEDLMCADDFYALRCAYLHTGSEDLSGQRARRFFARVHLTVSPPTCESIFNRIKVGDDEILSHDVDELCRRVLRAAFHWYNGLPLTDDRKAYELGLLTLRAAFSDTPDGLWSLHRDGPKPEK